MKKALLVLLSAICALVSTDVSAETLYLDRPTFDAWNPTATVLTLDGLIGTPSYPQNYPGGAGHYTLAGTGLDFAGIDAVGTAFGAFETYLLGGSVAGGAFSMNGTDTLVGGRETTTFYMPSGVTLFGAYVGWHSAAAATLTMTTYFRDATVSTVTLFVNVRRQFFGIKGTEIDRVVFDSGVYGSYSPYMLFDDLAYASSPIAPVPEPAISGLLGLGLFACAAICRRRMTNN